MGRGPWVSSRLASFSGVTDAAAARARGEFVFRGPPGAAEADCGNRVGLGASGLL